MKVECPNCHSTYKIAEDRVPAGSEPLKVRCKKCGSVFDVRREEGTKEGPAEGAAVNWFVAIAGERKGPLSEEEVRRMIRSGEIGPETYVWRKGFAEWQRLRDVQEFQALLTPKPLSEEAQEDERTVVDVIPRFVSAPGEGATLAQQEAKPEPEVESTQMIWQRRETSVLFSLEDYKSRRKTRATKPVEVEKAAAKPVAERPAEGVQPRPTVISLEEAEVRKVAEGLRRRRKRKLAITYGIIGAVALVLIASVTVWFLSRPTPAPTPKEEVTQAQPKPEAPPKPKAPEAPQAVAAVEPPPSQPTTPPPPPPSQAEPQPLKGPETKPTKRPPATAQKTPQAPKTAPGPQSAPAPSPPAEDVNALLANLQNKGKTTEGRPSAEAKAPEEGEASLPEQLTPSQIASVIRKSRPRVEECLRKSGVTPGTSVTISTRLEISGSGKVTSVSVSNAQGAEECVKSVLSGLTFPRFKGAPMTFPYPLTVKP